MWSFWTDDSTVVAALFNAACFETPKTLKIPFSTMQKLHNLEESDAKTRFEFSGTTVLSFFVGVREIFIQMNFIVFLRKWVGNERRNVKNTNSECLSFHSGLASSDSVVWWLCQVMSSTRPCDHRSVLPLHGKSSTIIKNVQHFLGPPRFQIILDHSWQKHRFLCPIRPAVSADA